MTRSSRASGPSATWRGPRRRTWPRAASSTTSRRRFMVETLGDLTRTHYCGSLRGAHVGQTVTLMGWTATRRDLGGVVFLDLRDREGVCQVVARPEVSKAAHAAADRVRSEYVVAVVGEVEKRSPETVNPKLATGTVEVLAREIRVLSEAKTPPFPIEDEITTSEDIRLKYRYLDLRRPKMHANIKLRHRVTMEVRRYLDEQGFYEIETPMLTKSTPEGARDYLVPSRVHHGHFYALPQSPQIFKQILMISGMDRYFQIVRCFRDEDLRADRQPEFTQVDIEMSFPRMETVFTLVEPLFERVFALAGVEGKRPFPPMGLTEAMERYGSDKPDLRFGLPITDVTEQMATLGLDTFPGLIAEGARARAIALPAAGGLSGTRLRKVNEELWLGRIVGDARASKGNLFTLQGADQAASNLRKKGASETIRPSQRSEEHTSELPSHSDLVCRLLLEKKKRRTYATMHMDCTSLVPIAMLHIPLLPLLSLSLLSSRMASP